MATPRVLYRALADFIEPIRRLDRLTVNMFSDTGAAFRFECAKDNVCLY